MGIFYEHGYVFLSVSLIFFYDFVENIKYTFVLEHFSFFMTIIHKLWFDVSSKLLFFGTHNILNSSLFHVVQCCYLLAPKASNDVNLINFLSDKSW